MAGYTGEQRDSVSLNKLSYIFGADLLELFCLGLFYRGYFLWGCFFEANLCGLYCLGLICPGNSVGVLLSWAILTGHVFRDNCSYPTRVHTVYILSF